MKFTIKKDPLVGTTRAITKFLWFPMRINNVVKWMETASYLQEYVSYIEILHHERWSENVTKYRWRNKAWLTH